MPEQKTKYDIIIIGAGPAGYTAGIYCSRARHNTLLISGILPGGQLMNTTDVENYPGFDEGIMGPDLMLTMRKQTERMGTEIIDDEVISVDLKNNPLKVSTASSTFETEFSNSLYRRKSKKNWVRWRANVCRQGRLILCNM